MSILVPLALLVMAEVPAVGTPLLDPPIFKAPATPVAEVPARPVAAAPVAPAEPPPQPAVPPIGTPLLTFEPIETPAPAPAEAAEPAGPAETPDATQGSSGGSEATPEGLVAEPSPSGERRPWFGAQLDAGLPEGLGGSLVFLPVRFLRLQFGGVTNTASAGVRGGLTLVPFRFAITPTLTAEAGHLFEGNLTGAVGTFLGDSASRLPEGMVERVSYDFFTAQLGVEIGAPDRFLLCLRAGISRVHASMQGVPKELGKNTTLVPGTLRVRMTIPSVKLALLLYF